VQPLHAHKDYEVTGIRLIIDLAHIPRGHEMCKYISTDYSAHTTEPHDTPEDAFAAYSFFIVNHPDSTKRFNSVWPVYTVEVRSGDGIPKVFSRVLVMLEIDFDAGSANGAESLTVTLEVIKNVNTG